MEKDYIRKWSAVTCYHTLEAFNQSEPVTTAKEKFTLAINFSNNESTFFHHIFVIIKVNFKNPRQDFEDVFSMSRTIFRSIDYNYYILLNNFSTIWIRVIKIAVKYTLYWNYHTIPISYYKYW